MVTLAIGIVHQLDVFPQLDDIILFGKIMLQSEDLRYEIFDKLIGQNIRFAIYRLPQANCVQLVLQNSDMARTYHNLSDLNDQKGFVIAPFHVSQKHPIVQIVADEMLEGEDEIFDFLSAKIFSKRDRDISPINWGEGLDTYNRYDQVFNKFHSNVVDGNLQKLVLSRTFDTSKKTSIGQAFKRAYIKYADNFVYLCHTPESGTWLGASPEIILSGNQNNWKTDALAGTQKVIDRAKKILWDEKNIYEQGIVIRYMENQLQKIGVSCVSDTPRTIYSGDLAHLKSEFRFQLSPHNKVGNVLEILHPTPAVCGFPKDKAFDFILANEQYDRSYYSGFVGLLDPIAKTDLYVNLRCMQVSGDSLRLYAGGGIMPESESQMEWQETEYKLQTILSIL